MTWAQFRWLFFGFSGRLDRRAYALAGALTYLVRLFTFYKLATTADLESQAGSNWAFIFLAATLLTLFSGVALSAKRLQDCDKPAGPAWLFIILDVLMFIALCFFPGTPGPNRHGAASNAPPAGRQ
jgi:uncharacterized membrane protein YhaH (DUF805 family)